MGENRRSTPPKDVSRHDLIAVVSWLSVFLLCLAVFLGLWFFGYGAVRGVDMFAPNEEPDWLFLAGLLIMLIPVVFVSAYVWLRLMRGRVPDETVLEWLTMKPEVPLVRRILRAMYLRMYPKGS